MSRNRNYRGGHSRPDESRHCPGSWQQGDHMGTDTRMQYHTAPRSHWVDPPRGTSSIIFARPRSRQRYHSRRGRCMPPSNRPRPAKPPLDEAQECNTFPSAEQSCSSDKKWDGVDEFPHEDDVNLKGPYQKVHKYRGKYQLEGQEPRGRGQQKTLGPSFGELGFAAPGTVQGSSSCCGPTPLNISTSLPDKKTDSLEGASSITAKGAVENVWKKHLEFRQSALPTSEAEESKMLAAAIKLSLEQHEMEQLRVKLDEEERNSSLEVSLKEADSAQLPRRRPDSNTLASIGGSFKESFGTSTNLPKELPNFKETSKVDSSALGTSIPGERQRSDHKTCSLPLVPLDEDDHQASSDQSGAPKVRSTDYHRLPEQNPNSIKNSSRVPPVQHNRNTETREEVHGTKIESHISKTKNEQESLNNKGAQYDEKRKEAKEEKSIVEYQNQLSDLGCQSHLPELSGESSISCQASNTYSCEEEPTSQTRSTNSDSQVNNTAGNCTVHDASETSQEPFPGEMVMPIGSSVKADCGKSRLEGGVLAVGNAPEVNGGFDSDSLEPVAGNGEAAGNCGESKYLQPGLSDMCKGSEDITLTEGFSHIGDLAAHELRTADGSQPGNLKYESNQQVNSSHGVISSHEGEVPKHPHATTESSDEASVPSLSGETIRFQCQYDETVEDLEGIGVSKRPALPVQDTSSGIASAAHASAGNGNIREQTLTADMEKIVLSGSTEKGSLHGNNSSSLPEPGQTSSVPTSETRTSFSSRELDVNTLEVGQGLDSTSQLLKEDNFANITQDPITGQTSLPFGTGPALLSSYPYLNQPMPTMMGPAFPSMAHIAPWLVIPVANSSTAYPGNTGSPAMALYSFRGIIPGSMGMPTVMPPGLPVMWPGTTIAGSVNTAPPGISDPRCVP